MKNVIGCLTRSCAVITTAEGAKQVHLYKHKTIPSKQMAKEFADGSVANLDSGV